MAGLTEAAIFRLEHTIAVDALGTVSNAMAGVNPERYGYLPRIDDPGQKLTQTVEAFSSLNSNDLADTQRCITDLAIWDIARWTVPVLANQGSIQDRALGIFADFMPEPVVEAYAEKLRQKLCGIEIQFIQGASAYAAQERLDGKVGWSNGILLAERLARHDIGLGVVAAGNRSALPILNKAKRPLVVNATRCVPVGDSPFAAARLSWRGMDDAHILFRAAGIAKTKKYDLSNSSDDIIDFWCDAADALE